MGIFLVSEVYFEIGTQGLKSLSKCPHLFSFQNISLLIRINQLNELID